MKKLSILLSIILCITVFASCGEKKDDSNTTEAKQITFAYQYGLGYLPAKIVQEKKLVEKYYDGDITVNWKTIGSGAEVNEGIISGDLQGGFMGAPPAITGVMNEVPYKIFTEMSRAPNRLYTNDPNIKSLADFGTKDKIAVVGQGSTQHITLAKACKAVLNDAHALDKNLVEMPHPDGYQALVAGQVKGHVTSMPYTFKEMKDKNLYEVKDFVQTDFMGFPGSTHLVGVLANEINEDATLYDAIVKAFAEAIAFLKDEKNFPEIAKMFYEEEGCTEEEAIEYLKSDDLVFDGTLKGILNGAKFMSEENFLEKDAPKSIDELVFPGVKGE